MPKRKVLILGAIALLFVGVTVYFIIRGPRRSELDTGVSVLGLGERSRQFVREASDDCVSSWRAQAEKGDARGCYYLGLHAFFVDQDRAEAEKLLESAAQTLPEAQFTLARYYLEHGGSTKLGRALILMRAAAERDLPEAQLDLAVMYGRGLGVPRDHRECVWLLEKAAHGGSREARRRLLDLAVRDRTEWKKGPEQDHWLNELVEEGVPEALVYTARQQMSKAIEEEKEVPVEALRFLDQAIDKQYTPALLVRGSLLGQSKEKEEREKGLALIRKAASAGWVPAQLEMYRLLTEEKDSEAVEEAAQWLVKAEEALRGEAEGGDSLAAYRLGMVLVRYEGEAWNEGVRWLQRAAYAGQVRAQYELGLIYVQGEDEQEHQLGNHLLRLAAEGNHADAQYELGLNYRLGKGMAEPSDAEAVRWFLLAAAQGHPDAVHELEIAASEGVGMLKNEELSASLRAVLAEMGYQPAD